MDKVLAKKTFTVSVADVKKAFRDEKEFKATRDGMFGTLKYMAHGDGYVMVRASGAYPIVVTEDHWRNLPPVSADADG